MIPLLAFSLLTVPAETEAKCQVTATYIGSFANPDTPPLTSKPTTQVIPNNTLAQIQYQYDSSAPSGIAHSPNTTFTVSEAGVYQIIWSTSFIWTGLAKGTTATRNFRTDLWVNGQPVYSPSPFYGEMCTWNSLVWTAELPTGTALLSNSADTHIATLAAGDVINIYAYTSFTNPVNSTLGGNVNIQRASINIVKLAD